jgi:hypothetical protein
MLIDGGIVPADTGIDVGWDDTDFNSRNELCDVDAAFLAA